MFGPSELRVIAERAVRVAGDYVAEQFRQPMSMESKSSKHDVVTAHDSAAEQQVREVLAAACPGSRMVGEEGGSITLGEEGTDAHAVVWHVDPIDGTSNFAQGLAFFCVSVAAEVDGEIVAGAVLDPMANQLFSADHRQAHLNGATLRTPEGQPQHRATLITGYPTAADLERDGADALQRFQSWVDAFSSVRRTGSGALSILHVAAGWTDASLGTGVSAWDVAAAMLILRRAGGSFTPMWFSGHDEQADHHAPGYLALAPGAHYPNLTDAVADMTATRQRTARHSGGGR